MKQAAVSIALVASALALSGCTDTATKPQAAVDNLSRAALLSAACSSCHMAGGSVMTDISGWTPQALKLSLLDYKTDKTGSTVMHRLASGYSEDDIALISEYLGAPRE